MSEPTGSAFVVELTRFRGHPQTWGEEDTMPRSRPPYSQEYRQQMVDLVRGGRTPESLSREFEPTAQSIWNWVRQAERDEGTRTDGLTTEEKEELRRLRHTTLELECIDRIYLNVYVPISQTGAGTAHFFKRERRPGHQPRRHSNTSCVEH